MPNRTTVTEQDTEITERKPRVSREDWVLAAIDSLTKSGVDNIKVVVLAQKMGITSGSFYWHFKKLRDLLDAVLARWEQGLTEHIIQDARDFQGPADQRILKLMKQVIREGGAEYDHAISIWARTDDHARQAFNRALESRFEFAKWMFVQAGFPEKAARIHGRLMVTYLMGEATTDLRHKSNWEEVIEEQFEAIMCNRA